MKKEMTTLLLLFSAMLILVSCAGATQESEPTPYGIAQMAPTPPPPPNYEPRSVSTNPMSEVWRKGYWTYDGINFNWVPGSLIARPEPTAVWSADRWERRSYGWVYVPGFWQ